MLALHLVLLASFAFSSVAGCLTEGPDASGWNTPLDGFVATLRPATGADIVLRFDGPLPILDRDGQYRSAYRLVEESQSAYANPSATFLDQRLRVVALDSTCPHRADCAAQDSRTWYRQGSLPPYGMAFQRILERSNGLASLESGEIVPVSASVRRTGSHEIVTVIPNDAVDSWQSGRLSFQDGHLLPSQENLTVVSYESTGPLSLADAWPIEIPAVTARAWEGRMFPGEDVDEFGIGFTPLEFLNAVESSLSEETPCVVLFELFYRPPTMGGLPVLTQPDRHVSHLLLGSNDGAARLFKVTAWVDPINGKQFEVEPAGGTEIAFTCTQAQGSPWPQTSSGEFLDRVRAGPLPPGEISVFSFQLGFASKYRPAERSWHSYDAFVETAETSQSLLLNSVTIDANTGLLQHMRAPRHVLQPGAVDA